MRNIHVAGRTPDPDVPSRETSEFDPCVFQHQCRSRIKLTIRPPREHLAVGVPAVMSPQDTIEHTHLRGPEKRMRTWMYEEIASDGKWRKEKLRAKIKMMRCQL